MSLNVLTTLLLFPKTGYANILKKATLTGFLDHTIGFVDSYYLTDSRKEKKKKLVGGK
jgi:hypothetical protein